MKESLYRYWGRCIFHHPWARLLMSVLVLLTAAQLLLVIFWILPISTESHAIREEARSLELQLVRRAKAVQARESYEEAKRLVEDLDARLVTVIAQGDLVRALTDLANQNSVQIVSISTGERIESSGLSTWAQDLVLQGSYANLKGFFGGLNSLPGLTLINELQLEVNRGTGATVRAIANVVTVSNPLGQSRSE